VLKARLAFQRALLPATIQNAAHASFYQNLWGHLDWNAITSIESLSELPLVRKSDLQAAGNGAQIRGNQICDEALSSGTTGEPFVTIRGEREQRFIADFFTRLQLEHEAPNVVGRGIRISNPQHGSQVRVPTAVRLHDVGIYDRHCFTHCIRLLGARWNEPGVMPRCGLWVSSERCLRAFVQYLSATTGPIADSPLRFAFTFGFYVSQRLRQSVYSLLNARIVDRFSLSEIFGGATEDPKDGWYYFDPLVVPEVVSLEVGTPITEGVGELVLTALYPFQEAQPMVRYATGDLVRVSYQGVSRPGELAMRPMGRRAAAVFSPQTGKLLLSAVDLYEAIDALAWPARGHVFRDAREVVDPHGLGDARYLVESESIGETEHIHLRVQARPDRDCDCDVIRARLLRDDLLGRSPLLMRQVYSGATQFEVSVVDELEKWSFV
jgi:hypothetical protein